MLLRVPTRKARWMRSRRSLNKPFNIGEKSEGVWLELAGPEGSKEIIKAVLEF
jgi:hypothetical protein